MDTRVSYSTNRISPNPYCKTKRNKLTHLILIILLFYYGIKSWWWDGRCIKHAWEYKQCWKFLTVKTEDKRTNGRKRRIWEDNTKTNLWEAKCEIFWIAMSIIRGHYSDDGGNKHLWNIAKLLPKHTTQQPRRQLCSYSLPRESEISLSICFLTCLPALNTLHLTIDVECAAWSRPL